VFHAHFDTNHGAAVDVEQKVLLIGACRALTDAAWMCSYIFMVEQVKVWLRVSVHTGAHELPSGRLEFDGLDVFHRKHIL